MRQLKQLLWLPCLVTLLSLTEYMQGASYFYTISGQSRVIATVEEAGDFRNTGREKIFQMDEVGSGALIQALLSELKGKSANCDISIDGLEKKMKEFLKTIKERYSLTDSKEISATENSKKSNDPLVNCLLALKKGYKSQLNNIKKIFIESYIASNPKMKEAINNPSLAAAVVKKCLLPMNLPISSMREQLSEEFLARLIEQLENPEFGIDFAVMQIVWQTEGKDAPYDAVIIVKPNLIAKLSDAFKSLGYQQEE